VVINATATAFRMLRSHLSHSQNHPFDKAHNRYNDVLPTAASLVVLQQQGEPESRYINANYVRGPEGHPRRYIAAQGCVYACVKACVF
jgi:protein tyrosine phosphatase